MAPNAHMVSMPWCLSSSLPPLGGRLQIFSQAWDRFASDAWVRRMVQGFEIELVDLRDRLCPAPPLPEEGALVHAELLELRTKGSIELAHPSSTGLISNIFLVEKKDGRMRPVINLHHLNRLVKYRHFKMEGIHLLWDILLQEDWMIQLDLQDAYLTIPIQEPSWDLLRFRWHGRIWRFSCLPFGL